ncbi:hypothetical protein RRG08_066244 [Elysia crispata]|uniref:Uncharacterized protein n=1 Tax=Elysia crispata TaxID=231223 RepID=A0AAE1BCX8_9GAST|nr:hypothetical protein RRG08_066244 [Elysia crispata]
MPRRTDLAGPRTSFISRFTQAREQRCGLPCSNRRGPSPGKTGVRPKRQKVLLKFAPPARTLARANTNRPGRINEPIRARTHARVVLGPARQDGGGGGAGDGDTLCWANLSPDEPLRADTRLEGLWDDETAGPACQVPCKQNLYIKSGFDTPCRLGLGGSPPTYKPTGLSSGYNARPAPEVYVCLPPLRLR